jgi:hypothetical protein
MLKGFYLTLLIGPGFPVPAPRDVTEAVTSVQVTNGGARGGFQIAFATSKQSSLTNTLIPSGYFDPGVRVIIVVTVGGMPNVLIDGVITRQEVTPSSEAGQSSFTVTGEDLSVLMDVLEMPFMRWPAMPDFTRVLAILAKYLVLGIVPIVIPPLFIDVPIPTQEIPSQKGTDLAYVQELASNNGYVFFIEPGPVPGTSFAYWGPEFALPNPQPALSINMDASTNVDSMTFSYDGWPRRSSCSRSSTPSPRRSPFPSRCPTSACCSRRWARASRCR